MRATSPARSSSRARLQRVVGELDGALERTLGIVGRGERRGALRRAREPVARVRLDRARVRVVRLGAVGVEQVRGDHLGDLVGVDPGALRQVARRREVLRLAIAARERLVGDTLDQRLDEAVLPALG